MVLGLLGTHLGPLICTERSLSFGKHLNLSAHTALNLKDAIINKKNSAFILKSRFKSDRGLLDINLYSVGEDYPFSPKKRLEFFLESKLTKALTFNTRLSALENKGFLREVGISFSKNKDSYVSFLFKEKTNLFSLSTNSHSKTSYVLFSLDINAKDLMCENAQFYASGKIGKHLLAHAGIGFDRTRTTKKLGIAYYAYYSNFYLKSIYAYLDLFYPEGLSSPKFSIKIHPRFDNHFFILNYTKTSTTHDFRFLYKTRLGFPKIGLKKAQSNKTAAPSSTRFQGYIFEDRNRNRIKDPHEQGLADVQIILEGKKKTYTTFSDYDGSFYFEDISPKEQNFKVSFNKETIPARLQSPAPGFNLSRTKQGNNQGFCIGESCGGCFFLGSTNILICRGLYCESIAVLLSIISRTSPRNSCILISLLPSSVKS